MIDYLGVCVPYSAPKYCVCVCAFFTAHRGNIIEERDGHKVIGRGGEKRHI